MAAITICSDFGAPKTKYDTVSPSIDYAKAFNYVDHNKLWKILKEMGIPDHLASGPITSWEIDGEIVETVSDFFIFGAPNSLQMVIAAIKLKDAYSLEEKLWPT